jgi:protein-S-isoprenylcysteine O-methyltransferase Ste14
MPYPSGMHPWFAKGAVLLSLIALIAIRAPHGQRSRSVKVAKSRKGRLEVALLMGAWVGALLPLLWLSFPIFAFADYPLHPAAYAVGLALLAGSLYVFHRSHADLGKNWSITLEVREGHTLVTEGIYRRIRHPMYLALFLFSLGEALVLPNWIVGPSYLATFGVLYLLRVDAEERMMREEFGAEYEAYMARTKRLIPGVY